MLKTFKIQYNGSEQDIQVETKLKPGVILPLVKRTMKYKAGQPLPEIDSEEWMLGLATSCIVKAPWPLQNVNALRDMDYDTFEQLAYILGDEFPLERFLSLGAKLMYGRKLEISISTLQTESTSNVSSSGTPSER